MKNLPVVKATPEQLPIISNQRLGAEVIRGAAGSGKTSTALLRLKSLLYLAEARKQRLGDVEPVKVLVLTFNRTLAGYVSSLAEAQLDGRHKAILSIYTFGKWATLALPNANVQEKECRALLERLVENSGLVNLSRAYLLKEIDYLIGRFKPEDLERYIDLERTGRGVVPRVDSATRRKILDNIVYPYLQYLVKNDIYDWNRLAVEMADTPGSLSYDIVVVDEAQDFSANQLRAINRHLHPDHAITFVIDTAQRIYVRGFTWVDAGFTIRSGSFYRLAANHRNTKEISAFCAAIMNGIVVDSDGALPNLMSAHRSGVLPEVAIGTYPEQVVWAINKIRGIDLAAESVAFLSPRGKGWMTYLKQSLVAAHLPFVEITKMSDWPRGAENIALCTFHSAKGLEFDHVFIIGLSDQNTEFDDPQVDDELLVLRRLFAVACARARDTLSVGYKRGEESRLMDYVGGGTYREVLL
ncbi:3'-5' exonuclease [Stenotrophomonas humi]